MKYTKTIELLIECFKKYPSVGEKTAERLALATLDLPEETINLFSRTLIDSKTKIKLCTVCNNYAEEELCDICKSDLRNRNLMCIVEESKNVVLFEKTGTYNGLYHVLGGHISPSEGISPEKLNITKIIDRIKKEKTEEVIIALNPSVEGEITARYISKMLKDHNIKVTKLAQGVPIGADMDYIDSLTLSMALNSRTTIE